MPRYRMRLFSREQLPDLLGLVTANARLRWPKGTYLLNSDVAWRLPGSRGDLAVWHDADGVAGYAWFGLITPSTFDVRAAAPFPEALAAEMLGWLEAKRREHPPLVPWLVELENMHQWERALDDGNPTRPGNDQVHLVEACDGDPDRQSWLAGQGYAATGHFGYFLTRSLDEPLPAPVLPRGWRIRPPGPTELDARVRVHRESWHRSSYSRDQYEAVRRIDVYDPELDLVAVSPQGEFASYCIGWADDALGIGSFEPVGTPPRWRRRGLARAVQLEGLRRMRAKGMHSAKIGTASFNDRAFGLYSACGFVLGDRVRTFRKSLA